MATPTTTKKPTTAKKAVAPVELRGSSSGIVTIPGVTTKKLTTLIIGTAPLMINKFSAKAEHMILAKHMGEASAGRERKDPVENFNGARHRLSDGTDGYPAGGMKAFLVGGFSKESGVPMTRAKGGIRVTADDPATNLVRILTPHEPRMRQDVVRNDSGVVDIRHRPEYWPWSMKLEIEFLPQIASAAQVLQALSMAGFTQGMGEWRPSSPESRSGTFGTSRLATDAEVEAFEDGRLFEMFDTPRLMAAE